MSELLGGKYVLEDRLGGGGMADVFRGRAVGADGFARPVAIKRMLPGYGDSPAFGEMFVAEARLSARLQHPNIVPVLDFARDEDGRPFLVIELVDGPNLDQVVATGALPVPVAIHVAAEVLRALAYAHELPAADDGVRGVVHRDVSPHNVLLSWEGAVKLSDFGIAKLRAATQATATDVVKGKPAYMSPEQANGESLDGRSDLFAVGVMLWELLCGRALFSGQTTQETLARLMFAPIPSPRDQRAEVPDDLAKVVMRLLARERGDRYRDAQGALSDLVACRDHPRTGREALVELLVERFPDRAPRAVVDRDAPTRLPGPLDGRRAQDRRRRWLAIAIAAAAVTGVAAALVVTQRSAQVAPPPPVDAAIDALSPRARNELALQAQYRGAPLPVDIGDPRRFEPHAFYRRALAEAESVLGKAMLTSAIWIDFDRSGHMDTTATGNAQYFFVARAAETSGGHCFALVDVAKGAGSLTVMRPTSGECKVGGIAPPRCTMAELWRRASEQGLPATAQLARAHRFMGSWTVTTGDFSAQFVNDCR